MEAESAVTCLVRFRKQNRAWKKQELHILSFRKCLQILLPKKIVFLP